MPATRSSTSKNAQALGDMQTLRAHGLEVVRIEVDGPDDVRRLV